MSTARADGIPARIRAARAWAGLKRNELGAQIGVSERQVTRLESGTATANHELRLAISEACDVPMWFMDHGWAGATQESAPDRMGVLEQRMSSIETLIHQRLGRELRDSIHEILEDVEQQRDADRQRTSRRTTESG